MNTYTQVYLIKERRYSQKNMISIQKWRIPRSKSMKPEKMSYIPRHAGYRNNSDCRSGIQNA